METSFLRKFSIEGKITNLSDLFSSISQLPEDAQIDALKTILMVLNPDVEQLRLQIASYLLSTASNQAKQDLANSAPNPEAD